MSGLNRRAPMLVALALIPFLALALVAGASSVLAYAGDKSLGGSHGSARGGKQGKTITVRTSIQTSVNGHSGAARKTGNLSSADNNWTPPACWYEPAFSPKEIEAVVKRMRALGVGVPFMGGIGAALGNVFDAYYKDGHPYKNYNLDKQGEGMFWARVVNPNRKDDPEAMACDRPPFWGDKGESPDEPLAVSPAVLAAYAYDELPVPDTEVAMAPPGGTKVNLPTWIWLDKAKFKKVSVTASIPGAGLSATTTARPVSLTIDPGTADAETFPASGECPIRGGRIGAPRAKGTPAETLPPCGVRYLRAPGQDGSYELNATLTWRISWTSTAGDGGGLPDGVYGAAQDVVVQEIQSVNR